MDYQSTFQASYKRCNINQEFLEVFLQNFCENNPRFSERFCGIDIENQTKMLRASIILIQNASQNPYIRNNVKSLGYRHKQMNLDIRSEELEAWQESLLYTVKKYDPFYNEQIDAAWRATLQVGIEIMQTECT